MHLESQALDAMFASEFRGFFPVRNDLFFPLPVQHLRELGGPAISGPVGHNVGRRAARASRKADNDFDFEHFREEHGLAEGVDVFLRVLGVGMNGIAVATERGDADATVFKLFQPGFGFRAVGDQVVERAVMIVGIAAGADFHGFQAESGDFVEHFVDRELFVNGIEDADGDFAEGCGWNAFGAAICG